MEMGVTLHVPRRRPRPLELVVRWRGGHTAADLRRALAEHLGHPVVGLLAAGRAVADDAVVGVPPLVDGVSLAVAPAGPQVDHAPEPAAALELAVVGGPDAGRSHPLAPPGVDVGRHPGAGFRLDDTSLSRRHARIEVGPAGVRVVDLGSTNGVLVDGRPVTAADLDTRSTLVIGRTTLRLRRAPGPGLPTVLPGDGTVRVATDPRPRRPGAALRVEAPAAPPVPPPGRVPWVAALVPLPVALGLAVFLGPHLLAFALLGPVMVLASAVGDRLSGRRQRRRAAAEHDRALGAARETLAAALRAEERQRHDEHPDPHTVLRRAEHRLPGLWAAREPTVRLGLGDVEARTSWGPAGAAEPVTAHDVPVVVDLAEAGCLGLVGDDATTRRLLDWLVGQLCVALPPGRLRLEADLGGWWRVPHARGRPTAEVLVRVRAVGGAVGTAGSRAAPWDGGLVVVQAADTASLPESCRAHVETDGRGAHVLVTADGRRTRFVADGVGPWWADRVARALAPLRPDPHGPAVPDEGPRLTLGRLLGSARLTAAGLRAGWDATDAGPVAVVGESGGRPYPVDLARDGPHVLVGGTTGSGKSEFLRTLVTGLAVGSPPERLALLLVDFKGGAAFGPCAHLPHVVGLVTDLDEHLAHRVLTSLRAELRRREQVLADAGVSDVADLPASGAAVPRLVVVVDELRALVDELPDLVHGLVRLAAQGRSLGIHLVLATQRPAGTVTPEVQANVDLRVAFRVRDRADSVDVLDAPDAALIAPGTPGCGLARGGDGVLTAFRTALVAPPPGGGPFLEVSDQGRPRPPAEATTDRAAEVAAVVDAVVAAAAARDVPPPHPPWLPPLPAVLHRDPGSVGTDVVALVDEPERQRRTSLRWAAGAGPWRLVGRPLSGRTWSLRAVVAAAVAGSPPGRLHVHVLDATGGLADVRGVPHLGTWCRVDDPAAAALVEHLAAEVAARRSADGAPAPPAGAPGPPPGLLLVVDGWDQLVEADDPRAPDPLSDRVLRVVRDGAAVGVHAAVSGGRSLLHSNWAGLGGTTVLLGRLDALDAAVAGLRERDLPRDPPPGRGVLGGEGRELQVVSTAPADLAEVAGRWPPPGPTERPWRYRPLPTVVRRAELVAPGPGLLLGAAGPQAAGWVWDPATTSGRLLVAGPPRSGRTTALRALAESAVLDGRAVALVSATAPGSGAPPPVPGVTVLGPADVDPLVGLRREHPGLVVLVDDADTLDEAPLAPVLAEVARLAARDGGAVVVATATSALAHRFRGLDVEAARHGCGLLLTPRPGDGELLGARLRAEPHAGPGRGVVVVHGVALPVQVFLPQSVAGPPGSSSGS